LVDIPTTVVVEDNSVSDADTPTALADVTADGASKDCFTAVPLVTHARLRESSRSNGQEEASRRESRRSKATDASDVTASAGNKDCNIAVPQVTHAARVRPLQGGDLQEGDPGGNPGKSEPSRVQTVVQGINVPDAVKIHIWTKARHRHLPG